VVYLEKKLVTSIFNGILFLICVSYLIISFSMSIGKPDNPGPGFVPITIGVMGTLLALGLLIKDIISKYDVKIEDFTKPGVLRFSGYVVSIFLFLVTYNYLGIPVLFLLVFSLAKIIGFRGWIYPLLFAGVFTSIVYFLFSLLQIPFPAGIF
jgi:Tripartite tricarboxylate transporter TctB family